MPLLDVELIAQDQNSASHATGDRNNKISTVQIRLQASLIRHKIARFGLTRQPD
jgi:hypothetical protein